MKHRLSLSLVRFQKSAETDSCQLASLFDWRNVATLSNEDRVLECRFNPVKEDDWDRYVEELAACKEGLRRRVDEEIAKSILDSLPINQTPQWDIRPLADDFCTRFNEQHGLKEGNRPIALLSDGAVCKLLNRFSGPGNALETHHSKHLKDYKNGDEGIIPALWNEPSQYDDLILLHQRAAWVEFVKPQDDPLDKEHCIANPDFGKFTITQADDTLHIRYNVRFRVMTNLWMCERHLNQKFPTVPTSSEPKDLGWIFNDEKAPTFTGERLPETA